MSWAGGDVDLSVFQGLIVADVLIDFVSSWCECKREIPVCPQSACALIIIIKEITMCIKYECRFNDST